MHAMRVVGALVAAVITCGGPQAEGQTLSAFSEFQAMPADSLRWLQVKLTRGGPGKGARVATALFTSSQNTPSVVPFVPFYRSSFVYALDENAEYGFSVSVQQLKAMIDSVATLPNVTDGGVDAGGLLSFALQNYYGGGSKVFESIVDGTNGQALFRELLEAFSVNDSATRILTGQACALGMMPGTPPQDVTGSVQVKLRGVRLDRKSGHFVGWLRVTNTSGSAIPGPIFAAVQIKRGASLAVQDGFTSCLTPPWGTPFITLPVAGPLGPGQNVQAKLSFLSPDLEHIELQSVRVLAGMGAP